MSILTILLLILGIYLLIGTGFFISFLKDGVGIWGSFLLGISWPYVIWS